jgi:hypothetical protein
MCKRAENQIALPQQKEEKPPYARFFSTERALFFIFGSQKVSKKETFDTKQILDVKGQKKKKTFADQNRGVRGVLKEKKHKKNTLETTKCQKIPKK